VGFTGVVSDLVADLPLAHLAAQGVQVESTPYPTVTDERLQHPDSGDWLR